jgi:glycylpeptide N-tetradecanoyltransferase
MSELPAEHRFWSGQPVPQLGEIVAHTGVIEEVDPSTVPQNPLTLPPAFEWSVISTTDPAQKQELDAFLRANYVTHPQHTFRFAYSAEFLDWALHAPGWNPDLIIGVRIISNKRLVAFISAIPITIRVESDVRTIVAIDFLSVHEKLRSKNLAPVLIKEITRRVHVAGMFEAVYTAGKVLTQPVTSSRYRHRLINYEKLAAINFTHLPAGQKMATMVKKYALSRTQRLPGFRPMAEGDVPVVTVKLNEYLSKFKVAQVFTEAEVAHWFLPRPSIVGSYVMQPGEEIEAFFSFYCVPSTVLSVPKYDQYIAAYIFYYFARPSQLIDLARAGIAAAHWDFNADVVNTLDVLDNKEFTDVLKFVDGDGNLNYYLYNYAVPTMPPEQMAIVLL